MVGQLSGAGGVLRASLSPLDFRWNSQASGRVPPNILVTVNHGNQAGLPGPGGRACQEGGTANGKASRLKLSASRCWGELVGAGARVSGEVTGETREAREQLPIAPALADQGKGFGFSVWLL